MLKKYLDEKPLYYDEIDYTRMPRVYEKIKSHFNIPKIIHMIGTNGKGTTGRFLASSLDSIGYKVGHYTSPHILEFNERIWLNGENVSDELLDKTHINLQNILTKEDSYSLSYFEYTTLIAMLIYKRCDYVVLEAGLGGEHDATAVFKKELTLVTPIDFDHEAFLGSTIEEIATTKLNAIDKNAIISSQKYKEISAIVKEISLKKRARIFEIEEFLDKKDLINIDIIAKNLDLVQYLQNNLQLSISALKFLKINYKVEDFLNSRLFGRVSKISDNILLDVGHNPLAATSIVKALSGDKYVLIYNSYKDKNYKEILSILKPIIKHVEIIDIFDERIESKAALQNVLNELKIEYTSLNNITSKNNYLVFGSFSVAEAFLSEYYE